MHLETKLLKVNVGFSSSWKIDFKESVAVITRKKKRTGEALSPWKTPFV
jgi:hypothetical protein